MTVWCPVHEVQVTKPQERQWCLVNLPTAALHTSQESVVSSGCHVLTAHLGQSQFLG
eukprot:CAMPEP_0176463340 /NCGR_PEP_ID=MMETSP0127-20121128/35821_1 /TAXON_ID=938130 /ORGANISM="Platyophrya macrostoma, Strain WH" /LENGTH=56 /DNA_ID=CAMNT_0017855463 /DNA_START=94 /DNA_END=260 /DNA_ORIENTATION=-